MKRVSTAIVAAGLALVIGAGAAQAQSLTVGVGGGLTLPMGDFNDAAKLGWHGLANVGYQMPSGLGLRGDFMYSQVSADEDAFGADGKFKLAGGIANVTYAFQTAGNIKPYIIGSVGYFSSKFEDGDSESDVAFGGGAGIKFRAGSDSNIFVEARYLSINSDPSANFIPVTVGVSFGLGK